MPVGISFYTFQTLSYTIDVYKRKLDPTIDFIAFTAFVSFFPQLVAGPIERATNLLPQFYSKRTFDYSKAVDGMRQILWGLFKKIVIADNCAEYANLIFNNSADYSGSTFVLGALFFTFQIYGDFSGYSDIAIGTSRLFGFDLMRNFNFLISQEILRSLETLAYFTIHLVSRLPYIPLGGSRGGTWDKVRNTFIIFIVSGFWHGANWTFIVWGALNAIYFLPLLLTNNNRNNLETVARGKLLPSLKEVYLMLLTFGLTVFAWILFRAENIGHAWHFIQDMFIGLTSKSGYVQTVNLFHWKIGLALPTIILSFILVEWFGRESQYAFENIGLKWKTPFRYVLYYTLLFTIIWFSGKEQEFIYFQF